MNPDDDQIARILRRARTIAVVGLSADPARPSHRIAAYLQQAGYRVIPVNPRLREVLGERARPDLASIGGPVDIVNVFRRTGAVSSLAGEALGMRPRPAVFWMQKGIAHGPAAGRLARAGVTVVQDLCIKTAHARLLAAAAG